jgi:subtilisin family serine protease
MTTAQAPSGSAASGLRTLVDVEQLRQAFHSATGKGVRVAVLDSGVDGTHPAFDGRVKAQFDVVTDRMGVRCVPAATMTDSIGHGTACAGIILQVAPEAELTSIKVIGTEARGTADQLICALAFALEQGFDVINMSLGTTDERITRRLSVLTDRAFYDGRIIVAAANNLGQVAFPAHFSAVLAVAMEGFDDPETLRYDLGTPVEVGARGVYVEAPAMGGGTQLFTGTSFACPHVSGMVARLRSLYPDLTAFEARSLLRLLASAKAPEQPK